MHVLMAAVGLSAILATSAIAFAVVKVVGAVYLICLGLGTLRSKGGSFLSDSNSRTISIRQIFRQGMVVAVLNPKVAVFFLAFLPQFVVAGAGPVWAQLFLHGSLIIVVAAFIEPFVVIAGARLVKFLRSSKRLGTWLDRSLGALFVGLGVRLALSEQ